MKHVGPLYEMPPEDLIYYYGGETDDTARSPDMRVTWTDYFGENHEIKFETPCSYKSTLIFPLHAKKWKWNDGEDNYARWGRVCDWV